MADAPWDDCKVSFGVDSPWEDGDRFYDGVEWPTGWEFDYLDGDGARLVMIFRVEGIPSRGDGPSNWCEYT